MSKSNPRQEFMATAGFALYTEVNDKLLGHLSTQSIAEPLYFLTTNNKLIEKNPAGSSLWFVMNQLVQQIPKYVDSSVFGVSRQDHKRTVGNTFNNGFADLSFTWHFAAGVANATADFFVEQGVLTQDQKNSFTLGDWANMIGSGWFSRLTHVLALTSNGQYGGFGAGLFDYSQGRFAQKLKTENIIDDAKDPVFEYSTKLEPTEDLVYATASLAKKPLQKLREKMRSGGDSIGCPVARYAVRLPQGLIETDPHTKALINNHVLRPNPDRSDDQFTHFTQEWSAIDKTLSLFAWQLDDYERRHGTPRFEIADRLSSDDTKIKHVRNEQPADVLRWKPQPTTVSTRLGAMSVENLGGVPENSKE